MKHSIQDIERFLHSKSGFIEASVHYMTENIDDIVKLSETDKVEMRKHKAQLARSAEQLAVLVRGL